jgi:predicted MFS family arabinose efflux permease
MLSIPGLSPATLRLSRTPLAALGSIGLIWGALVASLPDIKARIGAGDAELGVAILSSSVSAFVAMAIAPWIAARTRADVLVPVMAVTALAAVPLGLVTSVGTFALAMALAGMTTGLTDMLGNGRIAELEARHDVALMNLNHACFSFAYAGSAMLMGFARETGIAPSLWFSGIACVVLVLALAGRDGDGAGNVPKGPVTSVRGPIGLHAWLAGGVVLVAFFVENSTEIWAALHIERTLGGGAAEGALGPAMLGLTMGIGRLLGHLVTARGTEARVLASAAWLSGAGLILAAIAPGPLVAYVGFGLVGLGASVVAPLALALAGQAADPARRTLAVSRAMLLGYMGFVVGPPLLGLVSDSFGLRAAFGLAALSVLLVPLVLLPRMQRAAR